LKLQALVALVTVELKKLIRHPVNLFMNLLFPALLTVVFMITFSDPELGMSINSVVPGLVVYAVIFLIMTVAQSFSSERKLLRRLNTTPMTSSEFIVSQIISNMVTAMLQVIIVLVLAYLLSFRPESGFGGIFLAMFVTALFALSSVGLGLITATISRNPEMGVGLSFIFILPQMFFGTFMPLSSSTQEIAKFVPSHYLFNGLKLIFEDNWLNSSFFFDLAIISAVSVIVVVIGILLFEKYGKT
jgi:ABC-2 type transport system permease protein